MRRQICLSGLLTLGVLISTPVAAQDGQYTFMKGVQPGQYNDLNVWRALKLGTAPFVNPQLAKRSATAYKYQIYAMDDDQKAKIEALLKDGEIGVGQKDGDKFIVSNDPKKVEEALKESEAGTYFITSEPAKELGHGDAIVTWGSDAATEPVTR